jgi:hypothetical protein
VGRLNSGVRPHGVWFMANQVYVALIGEGVPVWRPVNARSVGPGVYELLGPKENGEEWEFQPGQLVECEEHSFSSGLVGLVARRPTAA